MPCALPSLAVALLMLMFGAITAKAQELILDTVLKRDKIIVATYSTSPPLAYADEKGDLVGFEIDMAHEIAKDLLGDPNKVEFVVVQSDGRFPAVLSGKVDFGLCSTTIYPDRAARIAFTRPYLDAGAILIARKDAKIKTIQELNDPQFTFAMVSRPEGFHLRPLAERCVNLSAHTAPIRRTRRSYLSANARRDAGSSLRWSQGRCLPVSCDQQGVCTSAWPMPPVTG